MKIIGKTLLGLTVALVAAFLFFRTADTDPAEMRAKYASEPSQFVALPNGLTVHLRDEGPAHGDKDALPIILLHGSNADLLTWNPWVERLADQYRIIRFDQAGHGLTGATVDETYEVATYVETIDHVADAMGLEHFVLGGNSMGGRYALAYALVHPDRVKGLILIDAAGVPQQQPASDDGGNIGFTIAQTPGIRQVMKHITPRSVVAQSLSQSVSNQSIVTEKAVDRYWEMLRYPGNRAATIARFSQNPEPFTATQITGLTMPALIIWGDQDALIPLAAGEWLDTHLPSSTFTILKNIGHLPMEEAPDDSAHAVRRWMIDTGLDGQLEDNDEIG